MADQVGDQDRVGASAEQLGGEGVAQHMGPEPADVGEPDLVAEC